MARAILICTPISRQIALSSKTGDILARTCYSSSSRSSLSSSSSTLTSSCRSRSCLPPHCTWVGTARVASLGSGGFGGMNSQAPLACQYHPVGGLCLSRFLHGGRVKTLLSTGCATERSEVEVEDGSKNPDREILVRHLLIKDDQIGLLGELEQQIHEGADLGELAIKHSACPSKSARGMIGWIKSGQTDGAFEEAAFNSTLDKVVRVKTKHGWHLLQVLNERAPRFLEHIQVEELHIRMQDPNFLEHAQLMDVREPEEIFTASIKGFVAYPLSQFADWAPTILDKLDPGKDTFVLCHHGMRSMQAANWLQSQGFRRVYNIAGGIHEYSKRVDPLIPKY